jgi:hypothetical protein
LPAAQECRRPGGQPLLTAALAEQDGADALAAEVEDQPAAAVVEAQHLVHGRRGQTLDPGDAVADRYDPALLGHPQAEVVACPASRPGATAARRRRSVDMIRCRGKGGQFVGEVQVQTARGRARGAGPSQQLPSSRKVTASRPQPERPLRDPPALFRRQRQRRWSRQPRRLSLRLRFARPRLVISGQQFPVLEQKIDQARLDRGTGQSRRAGRGEALGLGQALDFVRALDFLLFMRVDRGIALPLFGQGPRREPASAAIAPAPARRPAVPARGLFLLPVGQPALVLALQRPRAAPRSPGLGQYALDAARRRARVSSTGR